MGKGDYFSKRNFSQREMVDEVRFINGIFPHPSKILRVLKLEEFYPPSPKGKDP
jgi:hypothetical protein